jgi:hypothetical protein
VPSGHCWSRQAVQKVLSRWCLLHRHFKIRRVDVAAVEGSPVLAAPARYRRQRRAGRDSAGQGATRRDWGQLIPRSASRCERTSGDEMRACFGPGTAVVLPVAGAYRLIEPSTTRGERVMRCPRAKRGHSRDPDRGSEHASSDRPILEGCRRFIGFKSPALAEKYRQVSPRRKWRTS